MGRLKGSHDSGWEVDFVQRFHYSGMQTIKLPLTQRGTRSMPHGTCSSVFYHELHTRAGQPRTAETRLLISTVDSDDLTRPTAPKFSNKNVVNNK
ncbi:hypothetical protein TIFTF001_010375 [Ficus carica]|uniref:Uncharacterized protein n=1 Tax=Ficus carica TaxID=3494 RepID=A0AA87ZWC9_FICCA|nr:hypothetical protein TIFTF001_010375 [Ficus carica]